MPIKVLSVFGTRPEAIKMAPIVQALNDDIAFNHKVCITGQHKEMLDQVMFAFDIKADINLSIMQPGQTLTGVTCRVLRGVTDVLASFNPDLVLVHGDTTTSMSATLAAFYKNIPVAHVEAGLRTYNLAAPFPEEGNRAIIGRLAEFHFAPTKIAKQNLLNEAVPSNKIFVTGNSVIDALFWMSQKLEHMDSHRWVNDFGEELFNKITDQNNPILLITGHRRENFGQGFVDLCNAVADIAQSHPDWLVVYPVHLNPSVQRPVFRILGGLPNVHLIEPLSYVPFVWLMNRCQIILTDSGGIQEEGPSLGKPVLVMRDVTERPEAIAAGTVKLVGTDKEKIVREVELLAGNKSEYAAMAKAINPYGDGNATGRIIKAIKNHFGVKVEWLSSTEEFA